MQAPERQVTNGRPTVDDPTDLPDGAGVDIVGMDEAMSRDEQTDLQSSLDRALDDSEAGRSIDAREFLAQYRASCEARPDR